MKFMYACLICAALAAPGYSLTADEITKAVDNNLTSREGTMTLSLIDVKRGAVVKKMLAAVTYKKDAGTLMEFRQPPREKDKKILLIKDNMWMYVPGISKPIRLSGKDSFMGTSFSNRDLMDYDMNNDYASKIVETTDRDYRLELTATNRNVPYARIVMTVDRNSLLPVKQDLYTVSGNLIKTIEFSEVKDLGGKLRPAVMTVRDVLAQGNETRVVIEKMAERTVDSGIFSPQRLGR